MARRTNSIVFRLGVSRWWQARTPPKLEQDKHLTMINQVTRGVLKQFGYFVSEILLKRSLNKTGNIVLVGNHKSRFKYRRSLRPMWKRIRFYRRKYHTRALLKEKAIRRKQKRQKLPRMYLLAYIDYIIQKYFKRKYQYSLRLIKKSISNAEVFNTYLTNNKASVLRMIKRSIRYLRRLKFRRFRRFKRFKHFRRRRKLLGYRRSRPFTLRRPYICSLHRAIALGDSFLYSLPQSFSKVTTGLVGTLVDTDTDRFTKLKASFLLKVLKLMLDSPIRPEVVYYLANAYVTPPRSAFGKAFFRMARHAFEESRIRDQEYLKFKKLKALELKALAKKQDMAERLAKTLAKKQEMLAKKQDKIIPFDALGPSWAWFFEWAKEPGIAVPGNTLRGNPVPGNSAKALDTKASNIYPLDKK